MAGDGSRGPGDSEVGRGGVEEGARVLAPQWDPGRLSRGGRLHALARLIRVEHTLFSLPFAYAGAVLSGYPFGWREALLIFLALLGLRSAAMAYNNIADLPIDRLNPRSRMRPLVTGAVSIGEAYAVVAAGSLLYYLSAALLNKPALILSPILWLAAMTYPYAKRIHSLPHIHLGLVLGLAVLGGAVAACGDEAGSVAAALRAVPWDYVAAVTLWVAGFDVVYSIMDYEFDRRMGLGSLPRLLGPRLAAWAALGLHEAAAILFIVGTLARVPPLGLFSVVGSIAGSALMLLGDALVLGLGEEWVPRAFNMNLVVGLLVSGGIILDYLLSLA